MWPVVGHAPAVARLKRSLEKGSLGHAYLISGPPHVGKMTLAITLAQALNCRSPEAPCGACSQCQRIAAASHPDVQVVALGSGSSEEDARSRTKSRRSASSFGSSKHRANTPAPTRAGVLGMMRTTGQREPESARSLSWVTPAAMDSRQWSLVSRGAISSTTAARCCGFTASST